MQSLIFKEIALDSFSMELCYQNNPNSLFRKHAWLVTWFAQKFGDFLGIADYKEIVLLLPHGYQKRRDDVYQATFFTRPVYTKQLLLPLTKIDLLSEVIPDKAQLRKLFLTELGILQPTLDTILPLTRIHLLTRTFNPDANPESTSVDGYVGRTGVSEAWATIRGGSGNDASDTSTGSEGINVRMESSASTGASGNLQDIHRSVTLFDTSLLTSSATISAATASIYVLGRNISVNNFAVNLVVAVPASNTALINADYNIANWTMTLQSDTVTAVNSLTTSAYNDFALNTTGLGNVSKTGITKFGWVTGNDRSNSAPTYNANSQDDRFNFEYAENSGGHKPSLAVTYTLPLNMLISGEI